MRKIKVPHIQAAYKVIHIKSSPGKKISLQNAECSTINSYTDAGYTKSQVDKRSTSGY